MYRPHHLFSYKVVYSFILSLVATLSVSAAELDDEREKVLRPVTSAYTFEIGSSHINNTYLTPLKYSGLNFAFSYERLQAMAFDPEKWIMQLQTSISLDSDQNPAKNATMWDLSLSASWAMLRRFDVSAVNGLKIAAGGMTGIDLGALYLARNGNNPVSAKAAWNIGLTAAAIYNFKISRLPVTLRYQPSLPVTGLFFSPDYGELYYEIYLGNHSNLLHGAWWGNYFRFDNLLTADLRLGSTNLRLGYRCDYFSSKVNNIVSRRFSNTFVIGISGQWLSLPRSGKISPEAKIISALY